MFIDTHTLDVLIEIFVWPLKGPLK